MVGGELSSMSIKAEGADGQTVVCLLKRRGPLQFVGRCLNARLKVMWESEPGMLRDVRTAFEDWASSLTAVEMAERDLEDPEFLPGQTLSVRDQILVYLGRANLPATSTEIAHATGAKLATVSARMKELVDEQLVSAHEDYGVRGGLGYTLGRKES
jgi:hypothetical protein